MKFLKVGIISSIISLSFATNVYSAPDISLQMESKKLTIKEDKEVLSDIKAVRPGDIIVYTIKVLNKGNSAAVEVESEGKIPPNTTYIDDNQKSPHKVQFSIDNGVTFQDTPKINTVEKGKKVVKNAPVELYNKIKWIIKKVDPNQTYNLTYKVKVK